MGKKKSRDNQSSKGERRNVSVGTTRLIRQGKSEADRMIDKQTAWLNGGNPWITIANPNREETNRKFIRVRMNDLNGGSAKDRRSKFFVMK
jgi:hypothetical protein